MLQIQRGKLHGSLDVSLAVMSINKKAKRIDLDAGDNLYHLKVTTQHRSASFFQKQHLFMFSLSVSPSLSVHF